MGECRSPVILQRTEPRTCRENIGGLGGQAGGAPNIADQIVATYRNVLRERRELAETSLQAEIG